MDTVNGQQESSEKMHRARRARDELVAQFIYNPDVVLIDIGFPPGTMNGYQGEEIVVRIHVRENWIKLKPEERVEFPEEIDGIHVIVIPGNYHLDSDE
jgi:hypothetical protein